ncbi:Mitochondrial import inner membrane translocase subunit tim16-A [Amphibalanus amphitrite]|uniref:Mitochondrial import inner membrane translocase subunit tim16-A n=1 Tax=Amphibalanus amphitrite TaxID=1232801 RepID=A0A6A4VT12_AMPAM|nr:mitochondrial import inner membrane translocase subunit TIM16-like [Amphibalanus amphitrite]KAF0294744.1 Mitochondrial import inner membrane translocase subunit tim16-A [Amphibalanus amphitrite]
MAKYLAQIIVQGLQVAGRAFGRALKQEYEASQQAARARASSSQKSSDSTSPFGASISLDEAMKILNVDKLDPEKVQKNYDHLFKINDKAKGGSFYLQSKVVRAKERIDAELVAQAQSQTKDTGRGADTGQG